MIYSPPLAFHGTANTTLETVYIITPIAIKSQIQKTNSTDGNEKGMINMWAVKWLLL
jgi:hypothetical protein